MKRNNVKAAAIGVALCTLTVPMACLAGGTYTWLASPASADWDATTANWNDGTVSGVPWVDNAADPNDAVFPASSTTELTVGSQRYVNNLTFNGTGYKFSGSGPLTISGIVDLVGGGATFNGPLASGRADGTLHFACTKTVYVKGVNLQTSTWIDGSGIFAPSSDNAFGAVPAVPTENIFITGMPTIYGGGSFSVHGNRTIKIASGKNFLTRTDSRNFIYKCQIVAEDSPGCGYSTNTYVTVSSSTVHPITFDPGAGRTNAFGRLQCNGQLKIVSGVTKLTGRGGTDANAYLKVGGDNSSFKDTKGALVVNGGEIYIPSTFTSYVDVRTYGQVTVTNGGKVYMPGVHWLNGLEGPGRLTVTDGGEFTVATFRLSQAGTTRKSEVYLNEGGTFRTKSLFLDVKGQKCDFHFNGGTFQSLRASLFNGDESRWNSDIRFLVDEGGAVFDTGNGVDVSWNHPLVSGVAEGETDGGVRKAAGSGALILMKPNSYNGATQVDGGEVHVRADNALPPGTVLKMSNDAVVCCHTSDLESPQRDTTNWLSRVEGNGTIDHSSQLHITNSIAPSIGGEISFSYPCDLRGTYEISGDATTCGCIMMQAAGQDISGLTLKIVDVGSLNMKASRTQYPILHAPNGYTGRFVLPADWSDRWDVKYTATDAYLCRRKGIDISFR